MSESLVYLRDRTPVISSLELCSLPESPALVSRGSLGLEAGSCFLFVLLPARARPHSFLSSTTASRSS